MPENISISVVIPAFNAAKTIVASVESCFNQTTAPFEVIVVDDASSDNTVSLLQNHFGKRITLFQQQKNLGPSAARNRGVEAASGTHIAFQDADDIWHPKKLELVIRTLKENPKISFLFHRYTLEMFGDEMEMNEQPKRFSFGKLLLRNVVAMPCAIIRRDIMRSFNERMKYMEDYELFLRLAHKHGLYLLDLPLTRLGRPVLSAGGQSEQKLKMRMGEVRAWWSLCKEVPGYFLLMPFLVVLSAVKHLGKSAARILKSN